jgi:capsular exopolysaccharide synthesis family protein
MSNSLKTTVNGNGQLKVNRTSGLQKQWKLIKKKKFLFLISCTTCLAIAFIINRYSKPIYVVSSIISVSEKDKNNPANLLLQGKADNASSESFSGVNITQEIAMLTSIPFIQKAIDALDFKASYFRKDKIGETELYEISPFKIAFQDTSLMSGIMGKKFMIKFRSNQTFVVMEKSQKEVANLSVNNIGKPFSLYGCPLLINATKYFNADRDTKKDYFFKVNYSENLAYDFKEGLEILSEDSESGILGITLKTSVPEKGVVFLNELTRQYIKDKYEEKSRSASQALAFINEQINSVKNTLGGTESSLANFKASNTFSDPSAMTNRNLDALAEVDNERFNLRQQDSYYSSLANDLNTNASVDQLISPFSVGIQDQGTGNLINQLADLQTQKNSYAASGDSKNPYLQELDKKINANKNALKESVKKVQNTNRARMAQLNSRAGQFQSNVYRIPLAEKQFTDINRSRDFNDNLYQFLMQKRVEAGIMKASATIEDKIVEPAYYSSVPLEPKTGRNYIFGFVIGFLLPLGYVKLRSALVREVGEKEDIQDVTSIPIVGSIYHNLDTSSLVIKKDSRTAVSESFRIIRYNLAHFAKDSSKKVILFTSTKSGEGKSFTSINIALSFAIAKKKTVLMNLDLRLPSKAYDEISSGADVGISSYLEDITPISDIIQKTDNHYLDYISTGELPTSPAELLMEGSRLENLIGYLRTVYDYIIIDTPPLGVVADPLIISSYSDLIVLVVREKYTLKENLFELEEMYVEGKIKNVVMVVNDVRLDKKGYKNAYYYKKQHS